MFLKRTPFEAGSDPFTFRPLLKELGISRQDLVVSHAFKDPPPGTAPGANGVIISEDTDGMYIFCTLEGFYRGLPLRLFHRARICPKTSPAVPNVRLDVEYASDGRPRWRAGDNRVTLSPTRPADANEPDLEIPPDKRAKDDAKLGGFAVHIGTVGSDFDLYILAPPSSTTVGSIFTRARIARAMDLATALLRHVLNGGASSRLDVRHGDLRADGTGWSLFRSDSAAALTGTSALSALHCEDIAGFFADLNAETVRGLSDGGALDDWQDLDTVLDVMSSFRIFFSTQQKHRREPVDYGNDDVGLRKNAERLLSSWVPFEHPERALAGGTIALWVAAKGGHYVAVDKGAGDSGVRWAPTASTLVPRPDLYKWHDVLRDDRKVTLKKYYFLATSAAPGFSARAGYRRYIYNPQGAGILLKTYMSNPMADVKLYVAPLAHLLGEKELKGEPFRSTLKSFYAREAGIAKLEIDAEETLRKGLAATARCDEPGHLRAEFGYVRDIGKDIDRDGLIKIFMAIFKDAFQRGLDFFGNDLDCFGLLAVGGETGLVRLLSNFQEAAHDMRMQLIDQLKASQPVTAELALLGVMDGWIDRMVHPRSQGAPFEGRWHLILRVLRSHDQRFSLVTVDETLRFFAGIPRPVLLRACDFSVFQALFPLVASELGASGGGSSAQHDAAVFSLEATRVASNVVTRENYDGLIDVLIVLLLYSAFAALALKESAAGAAASSFQIFFGKRGLRGLDISISVGDTVLSPEPSWVAIHQLLDVFNKLGAAVASKQDGIITVAKGRLLKAVEMPLTAVEALRKLLKSLALDVLGITKRARGNVRIPDTPASLLCHAIMENMMSAATRNLPEGATPPDWDALAAALADSVGARAEALCRDDRLKFASVITGATLRGLGANEFKRWLSIAPLSAPSGPPPSSADSPFVTYTIAFNRAYHAGKTRNHAFVVPGLARVAAQSGVDHTALLYLGLTVLERDSPWFERAHKVPRGNRAATAALRLEAAKAEVEDFECALRDVLVTETGLPVGQEPHESVEWLLRVPTRGWRHLLDIVCSLDDVAARRYLVQLEGKVTISKERLKFRLFLSVLRHRLPSCLTHADLTVAVRIVKGASPRLPLAEAPVHDVDAIIDALSFAKGEVESRRHAVTHMRKLQRLFMMLNLPPDEETGRVPYEQTRDIPAEQLPALSLVPALSGVYAPFAALRPGGPGDSAPVFDVATARKRLVDQLLATEADELAPAHPAFGRWHSNVAALRHVFAAGCEESLPEGLYVPLVHFAIAAAGIYSDDDPTAGSQLRAMVLHCPPPPGDGGLDDSSPEFETFAWGVESPERYPERFLLARVTKLGGFDRWYAVRRAQPPPMQDEPEA